MTTGRSHKKSGCSCACAKAIRFISTSAGTISGYVTSNIKCIPNKYKKTFNSMEHKIASQYKILQKDLKKHLSIGKIKRDHKNLLLSLKKTNLFLSSLEGGAKSWWSWLFKS